MLFRVVVDVRDYPTYCVTALEFDSSEPLLEQAPDATVHSIHRFRVPIEEVRDLLRGIKGPQLHAVKEGMPITFRPGFLFVPGFDSDGEVVVIPEQTIGQEVKHGKKMIAHSVKEVRKVAFLPEQVFAVVPAVKDMVVSARFHAREGYHGGPPE